MADTFPTHPEEAKVLGGDRSKDVQLLASVVEARATDIDDPLDTHAVRVEPSVPLDTIELGTFRDHDRGGIPGIGEGQRSASRQPQVDAGVVATIGELRRSNGRHELDPAVPVFLPALEPLRPVGRSILPGAGGEHERGEDPDDRVPQHAPHSSSDGTALPAPPWSNEALPWDERRPMWIERKGFRVPRGVGIGLRRAHFAAYADSGAMPDWVEIVPEAFMGVGGLASRALSAAKERGALIPHGVTLDLGGEAPLEEARLSCLARWLESIDAPYHSDHVCTSAAGEVQSFDLLPLPFCEEAAEHVAARARRARATLGVPLALENITNYACMPGSTWSEGRFLTEVLERADAGLVLDVANVVVNAANHGADPVALLEALPLERTVHIHLAGHRRDDAWNLVIDDHASEVSLETLALYEHALARIGRPVPTLVEWDQRLPALEVLLTQARTIAARGVARGHVAAAHPEGA